jgi:recombination associated protein RdgC
MWFKNLALYRLDASFALPPGTLEKKLARHPLVPCQGLNARSRGWVPPQGEGALVYAQERRMLIALGTEEKLLPASVVNREARARAAELERQKGFKPGRKMLRELKEQVTTELLPRAFARQRVTRAWLDPQGGWLVVDTSSAARAEALIEFLRETLGELPVALLEPKKPLGDTMTRWLAQARAPAGLALGDECEVAGGGEEKPVVRYLRYELEGEDVRRHLGQGRRATRLKLVWQDRVSFVLQEPLALRRFSFLHVEQQREAAAESPKQSAEEQFDADFALMSGELERLLRDLSRHLHLQEAEAAE